MTDLMIRKAVVAGQFYSRDSKILRKDVQRMLNSAELSECNEPVRALVVPHAGYVYSGQVAATAYKQLKSSKRIKTVFLIGSSHRVSFEGASVYEMGYYETPLGKVKINSEIAHELITSNDLLNYNAEAHDVEHSLEVQLPFLQVQLDYDFNIVPVVMGTHDPQQCEAVAAALKPYFNTENLFVLSTDFSHYPDYYNAVEIDNHTAQVILKNNPALLLQELEALKAKAVTGLLTGLCGWTSVLTLLYLTEQESGIHYEHLVYKNSGDIEFGDKSRVVGYHAIAVRSSEVNKPQLTDDEQTYLLELVNHELRTYLGESSPSPKEQAFEMNHNHAGAFVSIYNGLQLRGCIGHFGGQSSLVTLVKEMTVAAAARDHRFEPVSKDELNELTFEISILTPLKKITDIGEIELGKHGIYIVQGKSHGVFLPQVAVKMGWSLEEFLGHCSKDKARIGWDGWRNADIFVFEAIVVSNKEE